MLGNFNGGYTLSSSNKFIKTEVDITDDHFRQWTAQQHYRTSYRDMSKKYQPPPKKYAVPGYAGYIPGTSSDTNFGSTYANTSKHQFNREKYLPERQIEVFPNRPQTQQVNRTLGKFGGGLHDEYHTVSRFHGKKTIPFQHPNFGPTTKETSYQTAYGPPQNQRGRMYRSTNMGSWKDVVTSGRPRTQSSGFVQNSTLFDGHGWLPTSNLHGNMVRTEYRNRYNPPVPFHPNPLKPVTRTMKKREWVY